MKKLIAMIAALTCMAAVSNATISVNWLTAEGIDSPFDGDTIGNDMPVGLFAQFIWSPSSAFSSFDDFSPLSLDAGFVLLGTFTDPNGGGFSVSGTYPDGVGPLVGVTEAQLLAGSVYIRVFSDDSPTAGDWWGQGAFTSPLNDQDPIAGLPNFADLAPDAVFSAWTQIVPEPSVLALAGLGALLVAVRRFRRA